MNKATKLGHSDLQINRMGLGCMGMSEFYGSVNEKESLRTLNEAIRLGVNFYDTADIYGNGANERLLRKAFKNKWHEVTIATKFAVVRDTNGAFIGLNVQPDYIRKACERSLRNLGTEAIDLYYLHRQDPEIAIEETVGTMAELVKQGKVKHIGLSEVAPEILRRAHAVHPISALQTEYSLWSREPEREILDVCRELGITFVAYSPLGRGYLTGTIKSRTDLEDIDYRLRIPRFTEQALLENYRYIKVMKHIAKEKGVSVAQIALAWILAQNEEIVTIPGTRNTHRLKENLGALEITMSKSDLLSIENALPSEAVGSRF
ncbi:MAG: aldo/keto reductase [Cyclobacteriaceae bacterium]